MKNRLFDKISANFRKTNNFKRFGAIILAVLVVAGVATTAAYLVSHTDPITNKFVVATIDATLEEEFDKEIKKNVKVENTGEVDEYVRVCVVINWKDKDGNVYGAGVKTTDYSVTYDTTYWEKGTDGFWYYKTALAVGAKTEALIGETGIKLTEEGKTNQPSGYYLSVDLLVQSIQAKPVTAVEEAWGVTVDSGVLVVGGGD